MNQKKMTTHQKMAIGTAGVSAGLILALALGAWADGDELDTDPRVFPYNGVLEFNGQSFTGQADFNLSLTDDGNCNFSEERDNVEVFAGRFAVNIGEESGGVPSCVFNAQRIFLTVGVRSAEEDGPYTTLSGRQRVNPVPFAYWAAEGSNFLVDGNANINGDLDVDGQTSLRNLTVEGGFNAQGPINNSRGVLAIADDLSINGSLTSDGNSLRIANNVELNGSLTPSNGTQVILGNLQVTGEVTDSNGPVTVNDDLTVTSDITTNGNLVLAGTLSDSNSNSVTIADGLQVNGGMNVNNAVSMGNNLRVEGSINRNGGDVSINDGLSVTNSAVIGGDLQVNGQAMRVSHNRVPSNGSTLGRSADDSVCFISGVESLNEQNDRCILTINGDNNWAYERREGECNVICMTWRAE